MTMLSYLRSKSSSFKKGAAALFLATSLMSCDEPIMKRDNPYSKIPLSSDITKVDYRDKIAKDPVCDDLARTVYKLKKRELRWDPYGSRIYNDDARYLAIKYNDRNAPNVCKDVMSEKYGDLGPTNILHIYMEPPPNGHYGPMPTGILPSVYWIIGSVTTSYIIYKMFID